MNQLIARGISFYGAKSAPGTPGAGGILSNERAAGVESEERRGRPANAAREALDGVHVQARGVVAEERGPLGARGPGGPEEPGRGKDGGVRVVDVPAPVARPGRGHELHRALRPVDARLPQATEVRLDEVHGGEHLPCHPAAPLGLRVEALELRDRERGTESNRRAWLLRGEEQEVAAGGDGVREVPCEASLQLP